MKFMVLLLASGYIVLILGAPSVLPVNPGGIGGLFKGPNSETIIKGPDGSVITSEQVGGAVLTEAKIEPIVVAEPVAAVAPVAQVATVPALSVEPLVAPVVTQSVVATAPAVIPSVAAAVPAVTNIEIAHQDPVIIETEIVDAPDIEPQQNSDLIGPSGTISTRGSSSVVSGPASTTISEPAPKATIVQTETVVATGVPVIATQTTPLVSAPITSVTSIGSSVPLGAAVSAATVNTVSLGVTAAPAIETGSITPGAINLGSVVSSTPATINLGAVTAGPGIQLASPGTLNGIANSIPVVEHVSSQGIINQAGALISSTPSPVQVSTLRPEVDVSQVIANFEASQLAANIPSSNIIPPEIGISDKLGQAVSLNQQVPSAPGLIGSNIQKIGNGAAENRAILEAANAALQNQANLDATLQNQAILEQRNKAVLQNQAQNQANLDALQNQGLLEQRNREALQNQALLEQRNQEVLQNQANLNAALQNQALLEENNKAALQNQALLSQNQALQQNNADLSVQNQELLANNPTLPNNQVLDQLNKASLQAGLNIENRALINNHQNIGDNQALLPNTQLLRDTRPIPSQNQAPLLQHELARQGIDLSQIQLANVPLEQVSGLPLDATNQRSQLRGENEIGLAVANRYGRKS